MNGDAELQSAQGALGLLLATGAVESRRVIEAMTAMGHSDRQIRRARERLRIVARRSGNGLNMRSTWQLPDADGQAGTPAPVSFVPPVDALGGASGADGAGEHQQAATGLQRADAAAAGPNAIAQVSMAKPQTQARQHSSRQPRAHALPADLTPLERQRAEARVEAFKTRGHLDSGDVWATVIQLLARDRAGARQVSCGECQANHGDPYCPCPATPRPITEIHSCDYCRRLSP